jgi:hypothetical protein
MHSWAAEWQLLVVGRGGLILFGTVGAVRLHFAYAAIPGCTPNKHCSSTLLLRPSDCRIM